MSAPKLILSLILVSSLNLQALSLPEIAQPVLALKALIDLAKLKEDYKKFYTRMTAQPKKELVQPAAQDSAKLAQTDSNSCSLAVTPAVAPVAPLKLTAQACDLAIDTAALCAATYLLYVSFQNSLQPKA